MAKVYLTDVTDEQWALIEPLLPPAKHGGAPRTVNLRLVFNTILYVNKTGCQWAMIPKDLAKRSTAFDYFTLWKKDGTWQTVMDTLRRQTRVEAGREPEPQKAVIDSQTVKGSEAGGPRGYDGGKKINGRKRHLIVDTLGLLMVVMVTPANIDDGTGAPAVLQRLSAEHTSRLDEIRGDSKYQNKVLARYIRDAQVTYQITVVERPAGAEGLVQLPYRWVAERTNAWHGKYRRHSKDYERTPESSEAMIKVSAIHLMMNRLRPDADAKHAPFTYERKPMKKAA
jgi:putative transposase